mmetsp:Transcript_98051/g.194103  ORF Transcript_98051/g.194103 Transcript_98051/m.194103 type:complete len:112 (+) Transcript_98051:726-1061(+)
MLAAAISLKKTLCCWCMQSALHVLSVAQCSPPVGGPEGGHNIAWMTHHTNCSKTVSLIEYALGDGETISAHDVDVDVHTWQRQDTRLRMLGQENLHLRSADSPATLQQGDC